MKIIETATNDWVYRFRCARCGSLFEATKEEFDEFDKKSKEMEEADFINFGILGKHKTNFWCPICNEEHTAIDIQQLKVMDNGTLI